MPDTPVSFENTEHAFAYKSDKALARANFLFSSMSHASLVRLGTRITPWAIRAGLPIRGIIRNTLFSQFVGGETLEETAVVADALEKFGVQVILDYGVEGKEGEASFDHSCDEFIRVIRYAGSQHNMPFISIKVTGFARFGLLEKLDAAAGEKEGYSGIIHTEILSASEKEEWARVEARMDRIMAAAAEGKAGVLVDAEETWIQDPVDALAMKMMRKYNRQRAVVYNTVQLYRHDRLAFLKNTAQSASEANFIAGVKIVRGAYLEKERRRAEEMNYPSPIQQSKESSDRDYDEAIEFCLSALDNLAVVIASHNENSNQYAIKLMKEKGIPNGHGHVHFSQLYGMSDNITFNLANAGYPVSKYLPFGPIKDVVPYLMRRAQENSSVAGQTGRELGLIRKEIIRRKQKRSLRDQQ
jgi:proline dehydrogenase